MKRILFLTLALVAAALLVATPSHAQQITVEVTVPFNFYVSNTELPAGTYQVSENPRHFILIKNIETQVSALVSTLPNNKKTLDSGTLVFRRYGEMHFLAEIRSPQRALNVHIPVSKTETDVKYGLTASQRNPETILIAFKQ
jgi:hypothetical protein